MNTKNQNQHFFNVEPLYHKDQVEFNLLKPVVKIEVDSADKDIAPGALKARRSMRPSRSMLQVKSLRPFSCK